MTYRLAAPLQEAVYGCLAGDSEVTALCPGGVFDSPPAGAPPELYIALGPEEVRERGDMSGRAALHRFEVSVVGTNQGFHAAKTLAAAVETALAAAPLTLPHGRVALLQFERARARRERNGTRRRIDLTFRALVDDGEL